MYRIDKLENTHLHYNKQNNNKIITNYNKVYVRCYTRL